MPMPRIVFATFGSLGDLHPVIALALEMKRRGHDVLVATTENYREKLSALGLAFRAIRPDLLAGGEHIVAEIMDGARGTERLMKAHMFPAVGDMYEDLAAIVPGADLLVASELVFVAPILAHTQRVPWVAYFLAPVSLFSMQDPPVLPLPPPLQWLPRLGPPALRMVKRLGKIVSHSWWRPLRKLRRRHGLSAGGHPLFEGKISPLLNLALYSPALQSPQPDWPAHTVQAGFCFFDENAGAAPAPLPQAVEEFLQAGEAPIVFTLGSAAVYIARDFYIESARAAEQIGRRALLLLGPNSPPPNLPPSILAWDYLPYASIFPRAAALVHQGGVGTTAQALRSGRPMLVVPFAHDQFDNAGRVVRIGTGRTITRPAYQAARVAAEISILLRKADYARMAAKIGAHIRAESGVTIAGNALERALQPGAQPGVEKS